MNFKPEVIADSSGKWTGNGLVFATRDESDAYAADLMWRWTSVREVRSVESEEPVTYRWNSATGLQRVAS